MVTAVSDASMVTTFLPVEPGGATVLDDRPWAAILQTPIAFIDHPSFQDPTALPAILAPSPDPESREERRSNVIPRGLPAYLESLYRVPLLTREREAHLFRQFNCLKGMAERLRRELVIGKGSVASRERIEALLERAFAIRDQILRANQRLVVSIAKKFAGPRGDLFEMISDANLPLIEAVERFDFSRGYRFSTYATWAIRNGLIRTVALERRRQERYVHGADELFESVADHREWLPESRLEPTQPGTTVRSLLERLNDRERVVLEGRYGLDGARQLSLRQIGAQIGVSKERARQIEIAACAKLRKLFNGPAFEAVTV